MVLMPEEDELFVRHTLFAGHDGCGEHIAGAGQKPEIICRHFSGKCQ